LKDVAFTLVKVKGSLS